MVDCCDVLVFPGFFPSHEIGPNIMYQAYLPVPPFLHNKGRLWSQYSPSLHAKYINAFLHISSLSDDLDVDCLLLLDVAIQYLLP